MSTANWIQLIVYLAALFALAAQAARPVFFVIALLPALSFWGLDAYYLRQERLFRKLYDGLRLAPDETCRKGEAFSLSTEPYEGEVQGWFRTLWSRTIIALHGIIVGSIVLVILIFYGLRAGG